MHANAADIRIAGILPGGGIVHKKVTSMREARFSNLVRQNTDYSCGSAAVATLLKYAYGKDVTEHEVLRGMIQVSDPALVRIKGFSLLDIKNYVETLGMRGYGYRLSLQMLEKIKFPTIVLLDTKGYKHFVVLKKATKNKVYLADPALGNKVMSIEDFRAGWNGVVFTVVGGGYDQDTVLRTLAKSLGVKRRSLQPPIRDAQPLEFGFLHADLLRF